MMLHLYQDGSPHWYREVATAATKRGHMARLFTHPMQVTTPGYTFTRIAQYPPHIDTDRKKVLATLALPGVKPIQDMTQIKVYEDKIAQTALWHEFMPKTALLFARQAALMAMESIPYPFISKSSVGSASLNVRLVKTKDEALAEIDASFGEGIIIRQGPGPSVKQRGYLIWQEFIPHDLTYRVTAVGTKRHVYSRFNYPDRPMAAPSKIVATQPVPEILTRELLTFSNAFFAAAKTQFCAIDVLWNPVAEKYALLETAQSWARGNDTAGNAPFYGSKHSLNTQHELLIEELEAGVFG